jgi:hypothetical protein
MVGLGSISALESIIRSDAKQVRLTEATRAPTLYKGDEDTSADTPHWRGRSDHPGHDHLSGNHRGSSGQELLRHHWRIAGDGQQGLYPSSAGSRRRGCPFHRAQRDQGHTLQVSYQGVEPPPDTFKDGSQALAMGTYGRDGVFHATELQAKCASKYAAAKPAPNTASLKTPAPATPAK